MSFDDIYNDAAATALKKALEGLFTITHYEEKTIHRGRYSVMLAKPSKNISASLSIDREALILIANYKDIQAKTIDVANDLIKSFRARVEKTIAIIAHSDQRGRNRLKNWGRESNLTVISIYIPDLSESFNVEEIRRLLNYELYSSDPFQVNGPVCSDMDFFGRRTEATDIARQLKNERILSIFGIRKIGKTSLINRIIESAKEAGDVHIAFIDCSSDRFYKLNAHDALTKVAQCIQYAIQDGYASIPDLPQQEGISYHSLFSSLLDLDDARAVALVFDELDYITPWNREAPHWETEFVDFWRELRSFYQEMTRRPLKLSMLVSGVSSTFFRIGYIGDRENPVLTFVPETYMQPFPRGASVAMLKALSNRCGLEWSPEGLDYIAERCGDFPYWCRMAASYFHRSLEIDKRPLKISLELTGSMFADFLEKEGVSIARVALLDLQKRFPDIPFRNFVTSEATKIPTDRVQIIASYGLTVGRRGSYAAKPGLISEALSQLETEGLLAPKGVTELNAPRYLEVTDTLALSTSAWAEELAVINRRRNLLEADIRYMIRATLRAGNRNRGAWHEHVLSALSCERRQKLTDISGASLMEKLYWIELKNIVSKNWTEFEGIFNDKKRFLSAMDNINDRPDAHAKLKHVDLAEIALQRRDLDWLEQCLK
jgi:hypothetical protein